MTPIEDFYGSKGALLFPEAEIYRARLLLAALDMGVASDALAKVDASMRANTVRPTPSGNFTANLDTAIESLSDGNADWHLEFTRMRSRDDGEVKFSVGWIVNGDRLGRADTLRPEPGTIVESLTGPIEAVLILPFNHIARAIWREFRE
ncbi:MAG: hypothetical protein GXP05_13995 [Alphaproteobacteria bacterium]|nr:hypothetical protein [Alphaproteobacteria bacterium]